MGLGILALLIASIIGGAISPTFVKLGVGELPPLIFTGLRFLVATVVFLPFFIFDKSVKPTRKDYKKLVFLSVFFIVNVLLFSFAIERTTVIMSQILYAFVPIIVAFSSIVFLKEKISKNQIIGGAFAFIGLLVLIFSSVQKENVLTFGTPLGNLLCLGAVFSWSAYLTYSRKLSHTYSAKVTSFFNFSLAMTFILLVSPIEFHEDIHFSTTAIVSLILTGALSSAAMVFLLQYGIKKTSALTASIFNYSSLFFASIAGVLVFHEKITSALIIGGSLLIFGVFYASTLPLIKHIQNRRK